MRRCGWRDVRFHRKPVPGGKLRPGGLDAIDIGLYLAGTLITKIRLGLKGLEDHLIKAHIHLYQAGGWVKGSGWKKPWAFHKS